MQTLHDGQGNFPDIETRFDDVAEFQKTNTQFVRPRLAPVDQSRLRHCRENSMRGRRMQPGRT